MAKLNFPDGLKYAKSDEWVKVEGDSVTIGLSDYAQDALNDIVFVELPSVGDKVKAGQAFGTVESVKAASDIYSHVEGEVTAVNDKLESSPELINSDPYGEGWLIKVKVGTAPSLDTLMEAKAYEEFCQTR